MKLSQNPFSLYDFLGYFIPGSLLIYVISIFQTKAIGTNVISVINNLNLNDINGYVPFVLLSYVSGHAISFISSYSIERYAIWKYSYPSKFLLNIPHDGYFGFIKNKKYNFIQKIKIFFKRLFVFLILFPITFFDFIVGSILNFGYLQNRKLDKTVSDLVKDNLKITFGHIKKDQQKTYLLDLLEEDFFTIIYHYTLEKNVNHTSKISNYVALYGFARSISFVLVIIFWYALYVFVCSGHFDIHILFCLGTISLLCYVFFLSFLKFYKRYSLEVIMAATVI